jgi:hypothetical protein
MVTTTRYGYGSGYEPYHPHPSACRYVQVPHFHVLSMFNTLCQGMSPGPVYPDPYYICHDNRVPCVSKRIHGVGDNEGCRLEAR